jgi:hypothetical protein
LEFALADARRPGSLFEVRNDRSESKYRAFVSYSRSADRDLARSLTSELQKFAIPWYRRRAHRVFRDESSLELDTTVWPPIERALESSDFLLLLASPRSAASGNVEHEIRLWCQSLGRSDRLLIVLTDGEIAWDASAAAFDWSRTDAVSEALNGTFDREPRYLDLRSLKKGEYSMDAPVFADAVATIAARLQGVSKDEIAGEAVRQFRRGVAARIAVGVVIAAAAIGSGVAIHMKSQSDENLYIENLVKAAISTSQVGLEALPGALLFSAHALARSHSPQADALANQGLLALIPVDSASAIPELPAQSAAVIDPEGHIIARLEGGEIVLRSTGGFSEVARIPLGESAPSSRLGNRLSIAVGGRRVALQTREAYSVWERASPKPVFQLELERGSRDRFSLSPLGRYIAIEKKTSQALRVHDLDSGRAALDFEDGRAPAFSSNDQFLAYANSGGAHVVGLPKGDSRSRIPSEDFISSIVLGDEGRIIGLSHWSPDSHEAAVIGTASQPEPRLSLASEDKLFWLDEKHQLATSLNREFGFVSIWSLTDGGVLHHLVAEEPLSNAAVISDAEGPIEIAAMGRRQLYSWNLRRPTPHETVLERNPRIGPGGSTLPDDYDPASTTFSPSGKIAVFNSDDGYRIVELQTGFHRRGLDGFAPDSIVAIAVNARDSHLVFARDFGLAVADLETGELVELPKRRDATTLGLEVSSNGRQVVALEESEDDGIELVTYRSGEPPKVIVEGIRPTPFGGGWQNSKWMASSGNGTRFAYVEGASLSRLPRIRFVDPENGEEPGGLDVPSRVNWLGFNHDGRWLLVIVGERIGDERIIIYDVVERRKEIDRSYRGALWARILPEGPLEVIIGQDGGSRVRLHALWRHEEMAAAICSTIRRELSAERWRLAMNTAPQPEVCPEL